MQPQQRPSSAPSDGWQADVQELWNQGQRQQAIDALLGRINAVAPRLPRQMGLQFTYYLWQLGDLKAAEQVLLQLNGAYPQDAEVVENLGVILGRQGRHQEARGWVEQAVALRPESANAWDGLASYCASAGDFDRARQAGEHALVLKTEAAQPLPGWQPPPLTPSAFLATRPDHHVIAYSLWGANPRYLRGALRNALLVPELYPGWTARFYIDATVPEGFAATARQLGADVVLMPEGQSLRQRLCWRFLVANDPGVGRFLVRDTDSVVNLRERRAVDQWLASEQWFHVMRDWWTHTDPVLAGMWGGVAGVLPDLTPLLSIYRPPAKETANVDQWFLRDVLWGSIRAHALIHDRYYRSAGSQPWPDPDPAGTYHVGQDEFSANPQRQAALLQGWIAATPWLEVEGERQAISVDLNLSVAPYPPEPGIILQGHKNLVAGPIELCLSGLYLNLEEALDRRKAMEAELAMAGLAGSHQRFQAWKATAEEARTKGLRSAGELGAWHSHVAALRQLIERAPSENALLHILEDDVVIHPVFSRWAHQLHRQNFGWDILFTDSFLSVDLYRKMLALLESRDCESELLMLGGGWYLACLASYLMPLQGAIKLLSLLEVELSRPTLEPIDMAVRRMIREGRLQAVIVAPFLTSVQPDFKSYIQDESRQSSVRRSQNLDLFLRRLLYIGSLEGDARSEFQLLMKSISDSFAQSEILEMAGLVLGSAKLRGFLPNY